MSDTIRSHLPNDNYRRGWDETFGKKPVDEVAPFPTDEQYAHLEKKFNTDSPLLSMQRFRHG